MTNNRDGTNERPQLKGASSSQGGDTTKHYFNDTTNGQLKDSRSRYAKGMSLYKEGKVRVGANGLFKVSGYYECDTEKMTCTCPDYRTRKESCKHLFAAMLFVKNRGKDKIEDLEGFNGNGNSRHKDTESIKEAVPKHQEAHSKDLSRQSTITRLAVINSAIELLKTHRKPIEIQEVLSLASQLKTWALSK